MEDHIEYETRALTETRYAQIEKMLAIVFHMERFNQCTFSRHVSVHSDRHKTAGNDTPEAILSRTPRTTDHDDKTTEIRR